MNESMEKEEGKWLWRDVRVAQARFLKAKYK
jgi:hypothetical protein